jgi:pyruvate formate lyase activating enzyme
MPSTLKLSKKHDSSDRLICLLCPHSCHIEPGERGLCGVRENTGSDITLTTYGVISGCALDPVEKKPLYHYYPGKHIMSVGSYGCNLKCDFCQNYHISQHFEKEGNYHFSPEELVSRSLKASGNIGIAFTYNEPVIWYEYVVDCARLASSEGLKSVMVTNGYVNHEPLAHLIEVIDAFNVDLKAFGNEFYRKYTGAALKPVMDTIRDIASSGRHLEITTLILPGLNDSVDSMRQEAEWIAANAGSRVPLHLSRYFPMYKRNDPPTPEETILRLKETASEYLDFVYTGNMSGTESGSDTICPGCHSTVIKRHGYHTSLTGLSGKGRCLKCNEVIIKWI